MYDMESTLIAINPVRANRAGDFEHWLRTVVVPAVERHRPAWDGRWRVLRAEQVKDGVVTFAFLLDGGPELNWQLRPLLEEALGPSDAEDSLRGMRQMLAGDHFGWFFVPVEFTAP